MSSHVMGPTSYKTTVCLDLCLVFGYVLALCSIELVNLHGLAHLWEKAPHNTTPNVGET